MYKKIKMRLPSKLNVTFIKEITWNTSHKNKLELTERT